MFLRLLFLATVLLPLSAATAQEYQIKIERGDLTQGLDNTQICAGVYVRTSGLPTGTRLGDGQVTFRWNANIMRDWGSTVLRFTNALSPTNCFLEPTPLDPDYARGTVESQTVAGVGTTRLRFDLVTAGGGYVAPTTWTRVGTLSFLACAFGECSCTRAGCQPGLRFEATLDPTETYLETDPGLVGTPQRIAQGSFLSANEPLPVELTSWTGATDGRDAVLRWTTESETDNAGFWIETRTADAWRDLTFVAGRGTTSESTIYAHRVAALPVGTHAFRLRQVDIDGTATHSAQVEVTIDDGRALVVEGRGGAVHVRVRETQSVRVDLFNLLGQRIATLHDGPLDGGEMHRLELPQAPGRGFYVVRAVAGAATASAQVVR